MNQKMKWGHRIGDLFFEIIYKAKSYLLILQTFLAK
jgi:hypothetical protein